MIISLAAYVGSALILNFITGINNLSTFYTMIPIKCILSLKETVLSLLSLKPWIIKIYFTV